MVPGVPTYVFFTGALNSVFTNTQNFVPSQVMCYRGSITSNPTVTGVTQISGSTNGGSALGTTSIGNNNASGYWTQPSNGVSILSSPINIYTGNSAIFGSSPIAADQHTVRLLRSPMPQATITNTLASNTRNSSVLFCYRSCFLESRRHEVDKSKLH